MSGAYASLHNVADAEYVSVDNWATPEQGYPHDEFALEEGFGDVQVNGQFVDWDAYSTEHAYALTTPLSPAR